jgi:hypothetical protein
MSNEIDYDTQIMLAVQLAGRATDYLAKVGYLPNDFHEYRAALAAAFLPFLVRETWTSTKRIMHGLSGGDVSTAASEHPEEAWVSTDADPIALPLAVRGDLLGHAVDRLETQASLWAIWRTWPASDWRYKQSEMFTSKVLQNAKDLGAWVIGEAETAGRLWARTQSALNMALVDAPEAKQASETRSEAAGQGGWETGNAGNDSILVATSERGGHGGEEMDIRQVAQRVGARVSRK